MASILANPKVIIAGIIVTTVLILSFVIIGLNSKCAKAKGKKNTKTKCQAKNVKKVITGKKNAAKPPKED